MPQPWIAYGALLTLAILLFGVAPLVMMVRRRRRAASGPPDFTVTIEGSPGGSVRYREGAHEHRFDWELAAKPPSLGYVYVPTYERWPHAVPWAPDRREEILERVAVEVRRQKCPGCRWEVEETMIHLWER